MNKYQALFAKGSTAINSKELASGIDSISYWEDGYWIAKILMSSDYGISDERIIEILEDCFFMGLTISNKEIFFDANECLSKLYIRYGMYDEAASKLIMLASNFSCPTWVHLYLAMAQLHTSTFDRIVEEPKFFFERLLQADIENYDSKKEIKNIFGNYLCMIVEKSVENDYLVASKEIVSFAERIKMTASEEFKIFHQTVCPKLPYETIYDESDEVVLLRKTASKAEEKASKLEAELQKSRKEHENVQGQLSESRSNYEAARAQLSKTQSEHKATKAQLEKAQREQQLAQEVYQKQLQASENVKQQLKSRNDSLEEEKTALQLRIQELEKAKQTQMEPQNIDDVVLTLNSWLNVSLRRYLAQWLTDNLTQSCRNNFWIKKVKPALRPKEQEKFDTYKELTDFAIDALLNIYYYNLDDFYSYNSMAKTNDRDRIKEMQQIRNRWVGHFEENSWTKEKILFDIDTILEFIDQIEMPNPRQKEYRDFRDLVQKMN